MLKLTLNMDRKKISNLESSLLRNFGILRVGLATTGKCGTYAHEYMSEFLKNLTFFLGNSHFSRPDTKHDEICITHTEACNANTTRLSKNNSSSSLTS